MTNILHYLPAAIEHTLLLEVETAGSVYFVISFKTCPADLRHRLENCLRWCADICSNRPRNSAKPSPKKQFHLYS